MHDKVDVLIIGSGASGVTVAWSLTDTNMRIVCLEQGDWVRPKHDPSNRRDRESHRYGDFATIPIRRGLPADYPINDDGSPIKIVNVNGVGGSTVMCMGHFPRLHPSDFKVRALDGVADDWPIDYDTPEPFYAENDRMMGLLRVLQLKKIFDLKIGIALELSPILVTGDQCNLFDRKSCLERPACSLIT